MSRRLLDTNIWIALAKGDPKAISALRKFSPSQVATCAIVRAEFINGARKSQRAEANRLTAELILAPYTSLPFDDRAANHYGAIRAELERADTPIGTNDVFIAAIALANDCILVTRNTREFLRIPALRLESWS